MLRYLIHIVGDIHQPLHATALFNDRFPNGDLGGNLFTIKFGIPVINNLHSLYDYGIAKLNNTLSRPLNHRDERYISETAKEIISEFPKTKFVSKINALYEDWVEEGHAIAQNFVYVDITINEVPSENYLDGAYQIIKERIALAGYRLAQLIKGIKKGYDTPVA